MNHMDAVIDEASAVVDYVASLELYLLLPVGRIVVCVNKSYQRDTETICSFIWVHVNMNYAVVTPSEESGV